MIPGSPDQERSMSGHKSLKTPRDSMDADPMLEQQFAESARFEDKIRSDFARVGYEK